MIEVMGLFLLDQVLEDADIFGLRNLDSECLIWFVTENKAVEWEELGGVRSCSLKRRGNLKNIRTTCKERTSGVLSRRFYQDV